MVQDSSSLEIALKSETNFQSDSKQLSEPKVNPHNENPQNRNP